MATTRKKVGLAPYVFVQRGSRDMLDTTLIPLPLTRDYRRPWVYEALQRFASSLPQVPKYALDGEHFEQVPRWALDIAKLVEASYTVKDARGKNTLRTNDLVRFLAWCASPFRFAPVTPALFDRIEAARTIAMSMLPDRVHRVPRATSTTALASQARRAMYALASIR